MANTLNLGTDGNWGVKKDSLLAYNSENGNFKPLPFDFTRASSATVVNKAGLIETVGSGEPRIDFSNDAKGALLLEPTRSNKVSTSNDFNGSGWSLSNLTATSNQVISPDGTLNASKLEMTGDGALRNNSEVSFNDGYAYSIFIKKGNSRYVTIRSAFFTQSIVVGFDLDTLTAQTNGKIEDYGNDWYRLSITKDISGDADRSGFFYLYLPNSLGSQTSVSGNYNYFYGGQIEDGSYATSYIPTQGSAVTRVADACNNGGNDQVINSTEGVLYAEISALTEDSGDSRRLTISDGTTNNRVSFELDETEGLIKLFFTGNGSLNQLTTTIDVSADFKIAASYNSSSLKLYVNGIKEGEDTSITLPIGLDNLSFDSGTGSSDFYGNVKDVRVYNTALTDAELQALTSN